MYWGFWSNISIYAELTKIHEWRTTGVGKQIRQMVIITAVLYSLLQMVPNHVFFYFNTISVRKQFPCIIEVWYADCYLQGNELFQGWQWLLFLRPAHFTSATDLLHPVSHALQCWRLTLMQHIKLGKLNLHIFIQKKLSG